MSLTDNEKLVKDRIAGDLRDHEITVLHHDGMYRHWRCQQSKTWSLGFDIVTWPGFLCFTGDMGEFLFCRTDDMVAFMRGSCMSYSYAAEKCVAGVVKEWSEQRFRQVLADRQEEGETFKVVRRGSYSEESVAEAIHVIENEYENYQSQHDAMKAVYESGLWDGVDLPSCEDYTYHFLWALHAIHWFCAKVQTEVAK